MLQSGYAREGACNLKKSLLPSSVHSILELLSLGINLYRGANNSLRLGIKLR
uniref:Uncharacterized protein n=1 Tax=Lepeophtheirus salmonis TaxID=72036 RepID=A0A0K2VF63_LEPSM